MRLLAIIGAALVCAASLAFAQQHRWDVLKAGQEPFTSNSVFTNHPDSAAGNVVEPANSPNIYLKIAAIDTTNSVFIGPWRTAVVVLRVDASNNLDTDDSMDVVIYCDGSYDNTNWTMLDSSVVTDTLWKSDVADSVLSMPATVYGGFRGTYIRLRPDPIAGMRQDTVGYRPFLNASVIYK